MTWFHGILWFFRLKIDKIPYLIKTLTGLGLVDLLQDYLKQSNSDRTPFIRIHIATSSAKKIELAHQN